MSWLLEPITSNTYWTWTENVFTSEELDRIVEQCKTLSIVSANIGTEFRQSNIAWVPTDNADFSWIYQRLSASVKNINESYFHFDLTHIQPLQFTEYHGDVNGVYSPHLDIGVEAPTRKLSFSLQLSDPTDHEGGVLQFHHLRVDPEQAPKARGKIIYFPSFIPHEVTPVTSGTRYSLVGWVAGPPFK